MAVRHLVLPMLALGLAGCFGEKVTEDSNAWYNKTVFENLTSRSNSPSPAATSSGVVAAAERTVPDTELYRSEVSCGGIALGSRRVASAAPSEPIQLDMTECDVARRAGAPDKIEISANEKGERFLVMGYTRGKDARVYRFASGRLVGIDAPEPARAQRSR